MTSSDFPEYAIKETKGAINARQALSPEQRKNLEEVIWDLTEDPARFEPLCRRSDTGQLIYKHPTLGLELTYSVDEAQKVVYVYHCSAPLPARQTIFISYSHEDVEWLKLLRKFLAVLEREDIIRFWDDSAIKAGDSWEESIRKALDSSCAAVLLVSQDFLTSKFITTYELPRLLSDAKRVGKKIFWIPVSPSTVFESNQEITVFEALTDDPRVSLEELPEAQQKKLLVIASQKLRGALDTRN